MRAAEDENSRRQVPDKAGKAVMKIIIDGKKISDRNSMYDSVRSQISCDMGSNLDALHDIITTGFSYRNVEIINADDLKSTLGDEYFDALCHMLECAEKESTGLHVSVGFSCSVMQ
ncbi:MAG: barstar family protein [Clostridia bacterium]|nr:barstar family protein [Clostridia bacterium]